MTNRWSAAWFVDENWSYSEESFAQIARAVGDDGARQLTRYAQMYRSMRENLRDKPTKGVVKKQVKDLGKSCSELLTALEMHDSTLDELNARSPNASSSKLRKEISESVTELRNIAWVTEREFNPYGRPADDSRRFLLGRICDVWSAANGSPTRTHKAGAEEGAFANFVRRCVEELPGFEHGLDDSIREIIDFQKNCI